MSYVDRIESVVLPNLVLLEAVQNIHDLQCKYLKVRLKLVSSLIKFKKCTQTGKSLFCDS